MGNRIFLRGDLQFFEGEREDSKNILRQARGMPIFLGAIERLSICNVINKPLHN